MSTLSGLPVSDHISDSAYLRVLIPEVLPASVDRVIYLDSDLIIRKDLTHLWKMPQDDHAVLAVQDYAAPYIDSSVAIPSYEHCKTYLAATRPVANYRDLAMSPHDKYFNTGLLVVDVDRWRRECISEQLLGCLDEHREHVLWWDQYALNVVLYDKWGELDRRWNQGSQLYLYPTETASPFAGGMYRQLANDPWVIHFTSPSKPWHYFCHHPATRDFYSCLRRTAWRDWQPERPEKFLRCFWGHHYKPVRDRWKTQTTELKTRLGLKRRAA